VLVFPGGTEIALEIGKSLRQNKLVELLGAGMKVSSHAEFFFNRYFAVPSVREEGWVDALNAIIAEQSVDFVFPAHDDALLALSRNRSKIKARIVTSPEKTCEITRSKSATYSLFADVLRVPKVFAAPAEIPSYPVFVKPDAGQGSQRSQPVSNCEELQVLLAKHRDLIVMEALPGREFTVDCFSDRERGLLFACGRERVRTRSGISMNCRRVEDARFRQIADTIANRLEFHGAWFFQLKEAADGQLALLEIAPRVAGTSAFCRVLGVNLPLLSIYEQERVAVEIQVNRLDVELDRALVNVYRHSLEFSTVYVDLDDTLIVRGGVNEELVRLLFQFSNQRKKLVLLSRHAGDLPGLLRRHRLLGLFDEIVHLQNGEPKSSMITDPKSIFIDDSFSERVEVGRARGIATFDQSMIEVLLNDRV
jgi:hypothetical protein